MVRPCLCFAQAGGRLVNKAPITPQGVEHIAICTNLIDLEMLTSTNPILVLTAQT